jgi:hypothetical protein
MAPGAWLQSESKTGGDCVYEVHISTRWMNVQGIIEELVAIIKKTRMPWRNLRLQESAGLG